MFVGEDRLVSLSWESARRVSLGNVLHGNKAKPINILSLSTQGGLPQIIHQMNTHDFCGTDLVAGLLLETLQRSVKTISWKY